MSLFIGNPKKLDDFKLVATREFDDITKLVYLTEKMTKLPITEIDGGKFFPCPNLTTREVHFVAGPSGSGKSTYTNQYVLQYLKLFPNRKVVVFSKFKNDVSCPYFGHPNVTIVPNSEVTEDFEDKFPNKLFKDSLVIFDDVDSIAVDYKVRIHTIMNRLLESGRHANTSMIITGHNIYNYKETKYILNESTHAVFFPHSNFFQIQNFLKRYIGMNTTQVRRIKDLPSRWVCLRKNYPTTIIHESGIYIL